MCAKISILLATYNGEKYLSQQLESLLNQTYKDFKIYVSDDFSEDATMEILKKYYRRYADRIIILQNSKKIGGACNNFLSLVERVESDIYFFCDQDDVWNADKIEKTIKIFETQSDKSVPLLVHSDLRVVDANLQILSPSYLSMTNKSKYLNWKEYLVENNNVVGCTMAINKTLADLYKRNSIHIFKDKLFMHDSFFAQLASLTGKIEFLDASLVEYRQHENNTVGATEKTSTLYSIRNKLRDYKQARYSFLNREENISEVIKCCKSFYNEKIIVAEEFSKLHKRNKIARWCFLIRNNIKRKSFFENIYVLFFI